MSTIGVRASTLLRPAVHTGYVPRKPILVTNKSNNENRACGLEVVAVLPRPGRDISLERERTQEWQTGARLFEDTELSQAERPVRGRVFLGVTARRLRKLVSWKAAQSEGLRRPFKSAMFSSICSIRQAHSQTSNRAWPPHSGVLAARSAAFRFLPVVVGSRQRL